MRRSNKSTFWLFTFATLATLGACSANPRVSAPAETPTTSKIATDVLAESVEPPIAVGEPGVASTVVTADNHTALSSAAPAAKTSTTSQATTTTSVPAADPTQACVEQLSVRQRAALVVWPAVYGDSLSSATELVRTSGIGGVILMTAPPASQAQAVRQMKDASALGVQVAVDEEGGTVQRLKSYGLLPAAQTAGSTMSADQIRALVAAHGAKIHELGIDIVLGPVVDVAPIGELGPLGTRTISDDPDRVAEVGRAYVEGWEQAGILPILKHFPGHGAATADTHISSARTPALSSLRERDLVPYSRLSGSGAGVMVGHLIVPGLSKDETLPATLDPDIVDGLLQHELGFKGPLIMSDALEMKAVSSKWTVAQASVQALRAGVDVVIFTSTAQVGPVIDAVVQAVGDGSLDEQRLTRGATRVAALSGPGFLSKCAVLLAKPA